MRHQVHKLYLGLPRGQRQLMVVNLATSLILKEKLQTTKAKAKALQQFMEKMVQSAKQSDKKLAIRAVKNFLQNNESSKKMIEDIAKRYQDRQSGFTRITNVGFRAGDAALLVQIELV